LSRNPDDGLAQGSGRSIPAFHLLNALESMPGLFVRFGGHSHAAGVTLEVDRVDEFRERFNAYAAGILRPEDLQRCTEIDAVLDLREINDRSAGEVFRLAPFGHSNPPPTFAALDVEVAGPPAIWCDKHLKVMVRQNGRTLVLKAWNFAERIAEFAAGSKLDVAFTLEEDSYAAARGNPGWAAILREVRQPERASEAAA
jgi:single-stranded-DNA-specific exonuclease